MKALFKLLGLLALAALLIASCIQEPVVEEPAVSSVQVTVGAGIASDPATKSEVVTDNGTRTLKFMAGDQLYVWKDVFQPHSDVRYVAGMLTMVGEPSEDGKSATFTGTINAYMNNGNKSNTYDFGDDPLIGTTATLIHEAMVSNTDYYINPNGSITIIPYADDVETLMTTRLMVTGSYTSGSGYALASDKPIIYCLLSGLEGSTTYQARLQSRISGGVSLKGTGIFTTDVSGVGSVAFTSNSGGKQDWEIEIICSGAKVGIISLGNRDLGAKVYNVQRWWNGSAFCAPTNLASKSADYTTSNCEILTGMLASDCDLSVRDGATVVLAGVTHHGGTYIDGITCLGSAKIILAEGTTNDLTHGDRASYNGICVLGNGNTLTISGTGTLIASGGPGCAGIGCWDSGANIIIDGGNITVTGGDGAAGIGANFQGNIGNISINGGNVTVTGGEGAAGIGCGSLYTDKIFCGNITFNGGTVVVNASSDGWGVGLCLGKEGYSCGDIKFVGGNVQVNGRIATDDDHGIYINGDNQSDNYIDADSESPFVYSGPVMP